MKKGNREILYSALLITLPLVGLFTFAIYQNINIKDELSQKKDTSQEIKIENKVTISPKLSALSAYVMDLNTKEVYYKKNENTAYPLASLTKIMTALVAKKNLPENQIVQIKKNDLTTDGESFLSLNEQFYLKDLIDFTLISSSNDAASAIASTLNTKDGFVLDMNILAAQIDLNNTVFKNETGLDLSEYEAGSSGSARDVAKLIEYILENYPEILENSSKTSLATKSINGIYHNINNTNIALNEIPGIIVSKTGFTDLAGGNLAVVADIGLNQPVVVVVLGSTTEGRFEDVIKIVNELKKVI